MGSPTSWREGMVHTQWVFPVAKKQNSRVHVRPPLDRGGDCGCGRRALPAVLATLWEARSPQGAQLRGQALRSQTSSCQLWGRGGLGALSGTSGRSCLSVGEAGVRDTHGDRPRVASRASSRPGMRRMAGQSPPGPRAPWRTPTPGRRAQGPQSAPRQSPSHKLPTCSQAARRAGWPQAHLAPVRGRRADAADRSHRVQLRPVQEPAGSPTRDCRWHLWQSEPIAGATRQPQAQPSALWWGVGTDQWSGWQWAPHLGVWRGLVPTSPGSPAAPRTVRWSLAPPCATSCQPRQTHSPRGRHTDPDTLGGPLQPSGSVVVASAGGLGPGQGCGPLPAQPPPPAPAQPRRSPGAPAPWCR